MNKIIYVPLEILEYRYTKMMDDLLVSAFNRADMTFVRIYGEELTTTIESGSFLDACGSNYFKFSQLQEIMRMFRNGEINNGDVFFFSDLWFPGIEAIKYTALFKKLDVRIVGVMHAGSWTDTDWLNYIEPWAKYVEQGWFRMFDKVFVGSEWHKYQIFEKARCVEQGKVIVTGVAWDTSYVLDMLESPISNVQDRAKIVVFPHRLTDEKQLGAFNLLKKRLEGKAVFIATQAFDRTKYQYYSMLAHARVMVSFSLQENFGYSTCEAITLGCVPVVPNRLSYVEYVPKEYRYDTFDECVALVAKYLENPISCDINVLNKWNDSVSKMVGETLAMVHR